MKRALRTRLRKLLSGRFSRGELHTLCFDLEIPYENLPERLDDLAREMIVFCEKRDRLADLVEMARELRPDIDWADLVLGTTPATRPSAGTSARAPLPADAMDAAAVAAATVELLSPYLSQAGEAAGGQEGEAAREKARQIHQAIVARLQDQEDDYPSETLKRFEEQPESRRGAMQSVLQEILDGDRAFTRELAALLQEADRAGAGATFNVNVFGGEVGQIINVDRLDGGLTIGEK